MRDGTLTEPQRYHDEAVQMEKKPDFPTSNRGDMILRKLRKKKLERYY